MSAIIHIAGNFGQYTNSAGPGVAFLTSTTSGHRQTANSRFGLLTRTGSSMGLSPVWSLAPADFWFHAVVYTNGQAVGSTNNPFITFYDSTSGNPQFRLIHTGTSNAIQAQYYDGTWHDLGSTFTMTGGTRYRLDIHLVFHASAGSMDIYLDESLVRAYSGALVSSNSRADQVLLESSFDSTAADKVWSELVVADYDTRGWNVVTMYPTADGAVTTWTGDYTSIDESIPDTGDLSATDGVNDIETYVVSNVPTGPDAQDLLAFALFVTGNIDTAGTPTDIQPVIRISGTNYAGSSLGFGDGIETKIATYTTDPSTGVGWGLTNLNGLEYGVKAV